MILLQKVSLLKNSVFTGAILTINIKMEFLKKGWTNHFNSFVFFKALKFVIRNHFPFDRDIPFDLCHVQDQCVRD